MQKYTKSPYNFDGCYICTESGQAESKGVSLSEEELIQAFKVQTARSKASGTLTRVAKHSGLFRSNNSDRTRT
jgi:tRNA U34 5-methylaminomethyl-2-thiouridine-forming methyltransferase MnmC